MSAVDVEESRKPITAEARGVCPDPTRFSSSDEIQAYLLNGVSRTFALTIPQLPLPLRAVVSNAYLLCRIVDTIEDEPALSPSQKHDFCAAFVDVVRAAGDAAKFAGKLAPLLSDSTIAMEHELIRHTPRVIEITRSFSPQQRHALSHCVAVMAEGMVEFQVRNNGRGLEDVPQLDRYCYYVAGIVGETLTKLFSDYSAEIAANERALMTLGVSFGQGLQMTNILKDIWDDLERGACWLPRDIFEETGFDLNTLAPVCNDPALGRGLLRLVGIALTHLDNAVRYTLLIPSRERGIRNFCLWAIAMAILTLRKLKNRLDFTAGSEVKISRRSVTASILAGRAAAGNDFLIRVLFNLASQGMPRGPTNGSDNGRSGPVDSSRRIKIEIPRRK